MLKYAENGYIMVFEKEKYVIISNRRLKCFPR